MTAARHNAFISYAWVDNQPFEAGQPGWVSIFVNGLRMHLGRELGRKEQGDRVWLDYEKLRGSDSIKGIIQSELESTHLLVPILSRGYLDSPQCRQELKAFLELHGANSGRIFPVWMEPVYELPPELDALLKYKFWYEDGAHRPRTRWFPGPDPTDRLYRDIQQDMAGDMAARLRELMLDENNGRPRSPQTEATPTRRLRVPDIAWVEVPAGEFVYGEGKQGETRRLDAFWIARYPITNAQYQCFIDDRGYDDERWWTRLKRPELAEPRWPQANRPRTDVDWYEAVAFCRWIGARLGVGADAIRLPTEPEWERVARGTDGRRYPWGNEFQSGLANVDEKNYGGGEWYLEQTTAVGLYPQGGSSAGVEDLSGTVWEWCLNRYEDIDAGTVDDSGASRALRGSSWLDDPDLARADDRHGLQPDFRNDDRGFRVLCSVPIS